MQKFIVLGHGYSEIFELKALLEYNHTRVDKAIFFHHEDAPSTFSLVMKPVEKDFQAIYTILRGLRNGPDGKMYEMIHNLCKEYGVEVIEMTSRDPEDFHEKELFFQYMIGVLRLNHLIPQLK